MVPRFQLCVLALLPGAAAAQVSAGDVAAKLTGMIVQYCEIPASQIGIRADPTGDLRLERSPTLTTEQNKCIDDAVVRSKVPMDGVAGVSDPLTPRAR